jgi:hypothetical protein
MKPIASNHRKSLSVLGIRMFLGLPDLDPAPDPYYHQAKVKKKPHFSCFVIVNDFLSLKNYVNVASKSNKQKN